MIVENALILAAGAGTRMGEIGKVLPKVLWPVFECSLLELEVLYAHHDVVTCDVDRDISTAYCFFRR